MRSTARLVFSLVGPTPGVGITVAPGGKFAYSTGASVVNGFSVDSMSSVLTPLPSNTVAPGSGGHIVFDLTGRYMCVPGSATISAYAFDATTGALTKVPGSPFTIAFGPAAIVVTAIP